MLNDILLCVIEIILDVHILFHLIVGGLEVKYSTQMVNNLATEGPFGHPPFTGKAKQIFSSVSDGQKL